VVNLAFTSGFVYLWWSFKTWYLNDLVAMAFISSLVSILHVNSYKSGMLLLVFYFGCSFLYLFKANYLKDHSLFMRNFSEGLFPMQIQLPKIGKFHNGENSATQIFDICSLISIFEFVFPGIYLGYLKRFDQK